MSATTASLVLGSGGARGLAHIGVIRWLTQHGYEIRSLAGSSMGALIGGIFAAGELEVYEHWVTALQKIDVIRLLDISFTPSGLIKGDRVIGVLRDLIGDRVIEDLPVSFTAVATDIKEQREVWLNRGPLFDAIRASIAIPMLFTPHRYLGMTLFDGGIVNPIPIAPTLTDRTDLTVAVDLGARPERGRRPPMPRHSTARADRSYQQQIAAFIDGLQLRLGRRDSRDVTIMEALSRSYETMQNTIARLKLAAYSPTVVVEIPRDVCNFYEFYRAQELIEIGWEHAERALRPLEG